MAVNIPNIFHRGNGVGFEMDNKEETGHFDKLSDRSLDRVSIFYSI